jgi:hypothetical protein
MENKTINLQTIADVAKGLQELRQKMVFVGGAVISIYTDDEAAEEIRPTGDIDLTIQVTGYAGWVQMQERICLLGFSPDPQGHSICSYLYQGISVDIMPSEDGPFGPSNRWYKPGFDYLYRLEKCNSPIFAISIGLTFLSIGIIPRKLLD